MKTNFLSFVAICIACAGMACSKTNSVKFKGDRANTGPLVTSAPVPGVAPNNGGVTSKVTGQGNVASLTVGTSTQSVSGSTTQGNKFYLNLSRQIR